MANRILIGAAATGYQDAVRELLGVSAQVLPNTAIDRENVITLAELMIIRQVPNYQAILDAAGDDATYLRSATLAQIAANCCPGLKAKFKTSEQSETGFKYTKEAVDWDKKKVVMEAMAQEYIGMISTVEAVGPVSQSPTLAGLTGPTRSAANSAQ